MYHFKITAFDTVVEMFHSLVEEQSVKIKLKLKDFDSEWKIAIAIATAVKKHGGFSILFENSEKIPCSLSMMMNPAR